jgi:hypothetical protein
VVRVIAARSQRKTSMLRCQSHSRPSAICPKKSFEFEVGALEFVILVEYGITIEYREYFLNT